jgi:hypothetical protein
MKISKYAVVYSIALAVASIGVPSMLTSSANARETKGIKGVSPAPPPSKTTIGTDKYGIKQRPSTNCKPPACTKCVTIFRPGPFGIGGTNTTYCN